MPYKEKETPKLPKIALTFEEVRKRIDAQIPDNVIKEIVKSGNKKKIEEINKAVNEMNYGKQGSKYAFDALSDEKIGKMFVKNPKVVTDAFSEMGGYARQEGGAFEALKNEKIRDLFLHAPMAVAGAFEKIGEHAKERAGDALGVLRDYYVGELFANSPERFVTLAGYAKLASGYAFDMLRNEKVRELFAGGGRVMDAKQNKEINVFEEMGKYNGFVKDDRVRELFVKHPGEFVDIAHAARNASWAFEVLGDKNVAELFKNLPLHQEEKTFEALVRIAEYVGERTGEAFETLKNEEVRNKFYRFVHNEITIETLITAMGLGTKK